MFRRFFMELIMGCCQVCEGCKELPRLLGFTLLAAGSEVSGLSGLRI